jgi:MFS family permease
MPPLVGALMDRFGSKAVAVVGSLIVAVAFSLFATATGTVANWLVLCALFGVAIQFVFQTLWYAAVASRFKVSRGIAIAIAMSGGALGAFSGPIMANLLTEGYGFRVAIVAMGVSWGGIVAVMSVLGLPGREPRLEQTAVPSLGLTLKEGLRSSVFFKLSLIILLSFTVLIALTIHLIPILSDVGVPRRIAVIAASCFGAGLFVGKISGGMAIDHFPARFVAALFNFTLAVSLMMLAVPSPSVPWAIGAALLAGLSYGGMALTYPYLASRHFGMRSFGQLFGAVSCAYSIASCIGPLIAGYVYDQTHNYALFLYGGIPGLAIAIFACLFLGPYPAFDTPSAADVVSPAPGTGQGGVVRLVGS